MRCWLCPRAITKGDWPKRVEWRRGIRGEEVVYGADQEPLDKVTGQLIRAAHGKCYYAKVNKERRAAQA